MFNPFSVFVRVFTFCQYRTRESKLIKQKTVGELTRAEERDERRKGLKGLNRDRV